MRSWYRLNGATLLCALGALACRPSAPLQRPVIAEVPHAGFRRDVPEDRRGNAVFDDAWWSSDGALFMTAYHLSPRLTLWDGRSGALITRIEALPVEGVALLDGRGRRFVGHRSGKRELAVFDLATGGVIGEIPEDTSGARLPLGLTADGNALVLAAPEGIELWSLDGPRLLRKTATALTPSQYRPACVGGLPATYNDKHCWELSGGGRWLAAAVTEQNSPPGPTRFFLIDLSTMAVAELELPAEAHDHTLAAFAFSPDDSRLAVGTYEGMWIYDLAERRWSGLIPGQHRRNRYLGPIRFSADGRRVIVLGDQMQTSIFDAATGSLLGRLEPAENDWEGIFRVSGDGSRVVLYHFTSDILEVLDGRDARRIGYVCPYYCNLVHQPVPVPFAVSPDGETVVASHRYGAALWRTGSDELVTPLNDPEMPPLGPPQ